MRTLTNKIGFAALAVGLLFFLGFGIESIAVMPPYAAVYVNDSAKTYIAIRCATSDPAQVEEKGSARLSTVKEAREVHYRPDRKCVEAEGFMAPARSLSGELLEKLGLLPPIHYSWDDPYRTEDGKIIYPHKD